MCDIRLNDVDTLAAIFRSAHEYIPLTTNESLLGKAVRDLSVATSTLVYLAKNKDERFSEISSFLRNKRASQEDKD